MIGSTGDREASVPFRVPVLLVGWGVRSIHAPENRFVVGLRVACAKALEIAVSAKHPILDRLLVAVASAAGVIGISGIYQQIVDSGWVQNAGTRAKRTIAEATTTRRSGIVTAIPLSPRGAATTGEAASSAPRVVPPAPAGAEPPKAQNSVAAVEVSPNETAPPPVDIPSDQATADPPAKPAAVASPVVRSAQRYVSRAPVVKKRVARTEHHRGSSGAYAQYGGGWGGWQGLGSPYHF
jgi:hypothetical protein